MTTLFRSWSMDGYQTPLITSSTWLYAISTYSTTLTTRIVRISQKPCVNHKAQLRGTRKWKQLGRSWSKSLRVFNIFTVFKSFIGTSSHATVPPLEAAADPSVLFCVKDKKWKITDFGLAAEGTSKKIYTTRYSRGTECYRAPELVKSHAGYNNKVDVWSLGCIFYELSIGTKPFASDFAVMQYGQGDEPDLFIPQLWHLDHRAQSFVISMICTSLAKDWWLRPSTTQIMDVIGAYDQKITPVTVGLTAADRRRMSVSQESPPRLKELIRRKRQEDVTLQTTLSDDNIAPQEKSRRDDIVWQAILGREDNLWSYVRWMPLWYIVNILLSVLIPISATCSLLTNYPSQPLPQVQCDLAHIATIKWGFFLTDETDFPAKRVKSSNRSSTSIWSAELREEATEWVAKVKVTLWFSFLIS